jgi:predicted kinase
MAMNEENPAHPPPALIIIGGFAGSGKTAISRRLSRELSIPRLSSDTIGRTVKNSAGIKNGDAYRIAYDVLFRLCEEFIQSGVSAILDLTMGWKFQWQHIDDIVRRYPKTVFLPIILRCPHETCIERTRQRHKANSEYYDPPEVYTTEPKILGTWEFLTHLDRPDIHFIDADRPHEETYEDVRKYVAAQLGIEPPCNV